jgi:hypothetical protein
MRHYHLLVAALVLVPSLASAESSSAPKTVALIKERLIQPLAAKDNEHSKFSRARLPPAERRVRMLDDKPQQDSGGEAFFAFAVDERAGWSDKADESDWRKAAITGCVYPGRGDVFIKRGNAYHPAAAAVGKKTKAAPDGTCHAAAQLSAR